MVIYTGPLQPIGQLHRVTPGSRQFIDAPQKSFLRGVGVELEAMSEQVQQGASRKTEQRSLDVAQVAPHPIVAPAMASFGARARPRAYPLPRQVSRLSVADSHSEPSCFPAADSSVVLSQGIVETDHMNRVLSLQLHTYL